MKCRCLEAKLVMIVTGRLLEDFIKNIDFIATLSHSKHSARACHNNNSAEGVTSKN